MDRLMCKYLKQSELSQLIKLLIDKGFNDDRIIINHT